MYVNDLDGGSSRDRRPDTVGTEALHLDPDPLPVGHDESEITDLRNIRTRAVDLVQNPVASGKPQTRRPQLADHLIRGTAGPNRGHTRMAESAHVVKSSQRKSADSASAGQRRLQSDHQGVVALLGFRSTPDGQVLRLGDGPLAPRQRRVAQGFRRWHVNVNDGVAALSSRPVALSAPSSEPGATPLPSLLFNISPPFSRHDLTPNPCPEKSGPVQQVCGVDLRRTTPAPQYRLGQRASSPHKHVHGLSHVDIM